MWSYGLEQTILIRSSLETFGEFFMKIAKDSKDFTDGIVRWSFWQSPSDSLPSAA